MINNWYHILLLFLRKVYVRFLYKSSRNINSIDNLDESQNLIYDKLKSGAPCMIARFGSIELDNVVNYIGRNIEHHSPLEFVFNKTPAWWIQEDRIKVLSSNAGFFPMGNYDLVDHFCHLIIHDSKEVDILGSWQDNEKYLKKELLNCQKVELGNLESFFAKLPWTRILAGKKVLVVHPFAKTIQKQYQKREYLFSNDLILPKLGALVTIEAIQSIGGHCNLFKTWFEALEYMKSEIDKVDYDICLLGCGAYGFPLAAHVKNKGKQAVHLGGALQLLFGIEGNRWFSPNSVHYEKFKNLKNSYWTKPSDSEKPEAASLVEGACYW